jgi:isoleucyl-tRNA synthetase
VVELEQLAGLAPGSITDLHKHHLDTVEIRRDGKTYRRTPEVLDCWFESGAMPYAQVHWMGGADGVSQPPVFPAQFIAEGLDQTRGLFYTLLVLSTALFDKPAFQNVVVNGLILAEDGAKMSKSKQNYPDPNLVLDTHGADALRAYLIDSPVVRAEPLRFSEAGLKEIVRTVVLPYWNALAFFTTYASVDGYDPRTWTARPVASRHVLDRWVLSVLQSLIRDVNAEMEGYRLYNVVPRLVAFIDDLTNWYIRANRARFWRSTDRADQTDAYATLYSVLTTFAQVLAPFMPFLTEEAYQRLVRPVDANAPASVHWCDFPQPESALINAELESQVGVVRTVVALGRKLREDHKLKVRQPLARLTVVSRDPAVRVAAQAQAAILAAELNVKDVAVSADEAAVVAVSVKPNLKVLGKRCGQKIKEIGAVLVTWGHADVARLEAGESIPVAGESLTVADVLLQRTPVAGAVVASAGAVTVTLDTALNEALVHEGLAREFVSVLQQARKEAGLEVSDRVTLTWESSDAAVSAALSTHASLIADDVLATAIIAGNGSVNADLNGHPLRFSLAKA